PALATGGGDGQVKVWTEEGVVSKGGAGHEGAVLGVSWHPGGEVLASSGQDSAVWLWSIDGHALSVIDIYRRWTVALSFSGSGDTLISCGRHALEGWALNPIQEGGATLSWRRPATLRATRAKIAQAYNLDQNTAQALRDHGATDWGSAASAAQAMRNVPAGPTAGALARAAAAWGYTPALAELWSSVSGSVVDPVGDHAERALASIRFLLEVGGVDPEVKDQNGMTVLCLAARHGRGRMVEVLLKAGARVDAEDNRGFTPACWAAAQGYSTILRDLCLSESYGLVPGKGRVHSRGADPDHATFDGDTASILAARGGHLSCLTVLEEAGTDMERPNSSGATPLMSASLEGQAGAVAFLAGLRGTDLDKRDSAEGMTALAAAASRGRTACVRALLSRGTNLTLSTKDGRTPIFLAAASGCLPTLEVLLGAFRTSTERRLGAWHPDVNGKTPPMAAAANGHLECLKLLAKTCEGEEDGAIGGDAYGGCGGQVAGGMGRTYCLSLNKGNGGEKSVGG
ncbi:unnamed protein product, partial [Choristocarpus tenellus]